MSRSKAKGTRWESAIVDFLQSNGVLYAERRALTGTQDRGDIAGIPGVVIEGKNAAEMKLAAWVDEAETERVNAKAHIALVWHHRRGKASPGDGYVTMTGSTLIRLLVAAGYIPPGPFLGGSDGYSPGTGEHVSDRSDDRLDPLESGP